MPNNQNQAKQARKKKGHTPAHQNTFAFKHNPKSKLTEKILTSPNTGVCRRCRDKIEWRKKYRKYKPLTQPGRCNLCRRGGVVTAAYHTICSACAGGKDALARLGGGDDGDGVGDGDGQTGDRDEERDNIGDETDTEDDTTKGNNNNNDDDGEEESGTVHCTPSHTTTTDSPKIIRACAICVREPALPDEADEAEQIEKKLLVEVDTLERRLGRSLKLRERKNLERKVKKSISGEDSTRRRSQEEENDDNADTVGDAVDDGQENEEKGDEEKGLRTNTHEFEENSEEEDPFLAAVGGADKLLTGDAYRRKLLEQQQETGTVG